MEFQPLEGQEGGHAKALWLDNISRLLYFKGAAARLDALQKTCACPSPRVNGPKSTEHCGGYRCVQFQVRNITTIAITFPTP